MYILLPSSQWLSSRIEAVLHKILNTLSTFVPNTVSTRHWKRKGTFSQQRHLILRMRDWTCLTIWIHVFFPFISKGIHVIPCNFSFEQSLWERTNGKSRHTHFHAICYHITIRLFYIPHHQALKMLTFSKLLWWCNLHCNDM